MGSGDREGALIRGGSGLRRPRVVAGALACAAVAALILAGRFSGQEIDPGHENRSTDPSGFRALTDLVRSYGGSVAVRTAGRALDPDRTAVVIDPAGLEPDDVANVVRFVQDGGRLVTSGTSPALTARLFATPPNGDSTVDSTPAVVAPVPEVDGITTVADAQARFPQAGSALPAVADAGGAWLVVGHEQRGRVLVLADLTPLTNRSLGRADNAALAIGLLGGAGQSIAFVEHAARPTGLAALPSRWKLSLALLGAAALVLVVGAGRRLGPPDRPARELPPPRRLYVESMAQLVKRARRPDDALVPLRTHLARILEQRGMSGQAIARQASALGLSEAEARVLLVRADSEDDLLLAGRAFARVTDNRGAST